MVPSEVERAASGRPVLQIAIDGWWERAEIIPLPFEDARESPAGIAAPTAGEVIAAADDAPGDRAAVGEVIAAAGERAVEVLWPGPPVVFVGARFRGERPPLAELGARADWTPATALEVLAGGALGPAVRAELGAVNAWRTVGPLPVRLDATADDLAQDLAARPDLAHCPHPVALEVVYEANREAWWAIEVSEPVAERVVRLLAAQRPSARPCR